MGVMLVTGGAGFIGSHLAAALAARGDAVRVLDNLSSGRAENLHGLDVELHIGDICDPKQVEKAVDGVEVVFHQAALVSVPRSMSDPLRWFQVNLMGSLNLLWCAQRAGVRRVVLASSAAVYGESEAPVPESGPLHPLSPYAEAKLAMEGAARLFSDAYGISCICLRYFNVYGPRQPANSPYAAVIPIFLEAMFSGRPPVIHGDGAQRRSFVFIDDVVQANLLAADRRDVHGSLNIASKKSVSILELAALLQEIIPNAPPPLFGPPRAGDIRSSSADGAAAERQLGFRSQVDIGQGLRRTIDWYSREGMRNP